MSNKLMQTYIMYVLQKTKENYYNVMIIIGLHTWRVDGGGMSRASLEPVGEGDARWVGIVAPWLH